MKCNVEIFSFIVSYTNPQTVKTLRINFDAVEGLLKKMEVYFVESSILLVKKR